MAPLEATPGRDPAAVVVIGPLQRPLAVGRRLAGRLSDAGRTVRRRDPERRSVPAGPSGTDRAQAGALLDALATRGHRVIAVVTDGTPRLAGLVDTLLGPVPEHLTVRPLAVGRAPNVHVTAVIVVAVHHRAATLARRLRALNFQGDLAFPDECGVTEFIELAGEAAAGALVAVPPGGLASRVAAAVAAAARALSADPTLTGAKLMAAVRARSHVPYELAGDPPSEFWTVRRLRDRF